MTEQLKRQKQISKHIYWQLIENNKVNTTAAKTVVLKSLNTDMTDEEWLELLPNFRKQVKSTKLIYFQYKILTGGLTTNIKRNMWDKNVPSTCTFCKKFPEMVAHILAECEEVIQLWSCLTKMIKYYWKMELTFKPEVIILNNYTGKNKHLINHTIAIMKHYIYATKCLNNELKFSEYMYKLSEWHTINKLQVCDTSNASNITKNYGKLCKQWADMF